MAEVLAAISVATESVSICLRVIVLLKKLTAAAKDARADLNAIVTLVGRTRNRLELIKVTLFELRGTIDSGVFANFLSCSTSLKQTLHKIQEEASNIVAGESYLGIAKKFKWATKKPKVQELIKALEGEEQQLTQEFILINLQTTLRTEEKVKKLVKISDEQSKLKVAFEDLAVDAGTIQPRSAAYMESRTTRTWLGHVLREKHSHDYLALRDGLSDASYLGDWDVLFQKMDKGLQRFGESWVNAPRMKSVQAYNFLTMWLPLHQAVYHHAPVEVVQKLLDQGAFRTIRTRDTEFSFADMSPLDLAYDLEVFHLYEILRPIIKRPVPLTTLEALELNFHSLIRHEVGQREDLEFLYLPVLEVLTELDGDTMWFPVKFKHEAAGYLYQLYGRELQVKSVNIQNPDEQVLYLITEREIILTDEIFNFTGDLERDMMELGQDL